MEEKVSNEMNTQVVSSESNDHGMQAKPGNLAHELNTVYRLTEKCKSFCYYFRNEWTSKTPRDVKIANKKWQEIRSDLIKRRLREKTNPIIDGVKHKKDKKLQEIRSKIINRRLRKKPNPIIDGEKHKDKKWQETRSKLINRKLQEKNKPIIDGEKHKKEPVATIASLLRASKLEQYIFSAITVFLYDHPEGANLKSIYSHINKSFKYALPADIKNVLKKYPQGYVEFVPTVAAHIPKKGKLL